jgi:hypothetical protein
MTYFYASYLVFWLAKRLPKRFGIERQKYRENQKAEFKRLNAQ